MAIHPHLESANYERTYFYRAFAIIFLNKEHNIDLFIGGNREGRIDTSQSDLFTQITENEFELAEPALLEYYGANVESFREQFAMNKDLHAPKIGSIEDLSEIIQPTSLVLPSLFLFEGLCCAYLTLNCSWDANGIAIRFKDGQVSILSQSEVITG